VLTGVLTADGSPVDRRAGTGPLPPSVIVVMIEFRFTFAEIATRSVLMGVVMTRNSAAAATENSSVTGALVIVKVLVKFRSADTIAEMVVEDWFGRTFGPTTALGLAVMPQKTG
jgi:hypothetical protein